MFIACANAHARGAGDFLFEPGGSFQFFEGKREVPSALSEEDHFWLAERSAKNLEERLAATCPSNEHPADGRADEAFRIYSDSDRLRQRLKARLAPYRGDLENPGLAVERIARQRVAQAVEEHASLRYKARLEVDAEVESLERLRRSAAAPAVIESQRNRVIAAKKNWDSYRYGGVPRVDLSSLRGIASARSEQALGRMKAFAGLNQRIDSLAQRAYNCHVIAGRTGKQLLQTVSSIMEITSEPAKAESAPQSKTEKLEGLAVSAQ